MEPELETSTPIGQIAALGAIITLLIAGLFWIFNVNSVANEAQRISNVNAERLEGKADKQDIQRIYDKLDEINKYLRDRK